MNADPPPSPSLSGSPPYTAKRKRSPSPSEQNAKRLRSSSPLSEGAKKSQLFQHQSASPNSPDAQLQQQQQPPQPLPPTETPPDSLSQEQRQQQQLHGDEADGKRQLPSDTVPRDQLSPIAHWAATSSWPPDIAQTGVSMAETSARNRPAPLKRQSSSSSTQSHRSSQIRRLKENGVLMQKSGSRLNEASKIFVDELLAPRPRNLKYMPFPLAQFDHVLDEVAHRNEARIVRDITPWVVPSPAILRWCGEPGLENIAEEIDTIWRCEPMGNSVPKPDFVVGLCPDVFTGQEQARLQNIASIRQPFFLTSELCFPFLMCEAKQGDRGLAEAERQNISSASVASRIVIELYETAFGSKSLEALNLSGRPLCFSVSHDNQRVALQCHYAIFEEANPVLPWKHYRHEFASASLSASDGDERDKAYSFVRNVYDKFVPLHAERIKAAAAALPEFNAAQSTIASSSQVQDSQDGGSGSFARPLDTAALLQELRAQNAQVERLTSQLADKDRRAERMEEQLNRLTEALTRRSS